MSYYVGEEVEVISTGEVSTIEAVTKNILRQERYKIVGNSTKYKESELRRYTSPTVYGNSITDTATSPDLVTQVVLANVYMDQMDDIVQEVTEHNNTIEELNTVIDSIPESKTEKVDTWVTERQDRWEAPVSTESKSVDVDTSSSRSSSVDDSTSSWRSSSSDDSSSSWRSSSSDDSSSSSRWSSSSDDSSSSWSSSSSDSSSYDSGSSSSSSSDW